jgi:hypothetical protein
LREEVRIMAALDHPNILRINECFEDEVSIKLILSLCHGGIILLCKYRIFHTCVYIHGDVDCWCVFVTFSHFITFPLQVSCWIDYTPKRSINTPKRWHVGTFSPW